MALDNVKLHLIQDMADIRQFEAWFESGPMQHGKMGVDSETTGLSPETDHARLVQLGDQNEGWAFAAEGELSSVAVFSDALKRFNGTMLMHNAPFDFAMIKKLGLTLDIERIHDTRIKSHIQEPTMSTALKPQATRHVDRRAGRAQRELDEAVERLGWGGVPITFAPYWQYGALDPVLTTQLDDYHSIGLPPESFEVENAVQFVLERMMRRGATIDVEYAGEMYGQFTRYCARMSEWVQKEFGVYPSENLQVLDVLEQAGYTFTKLTKTGATSSDKEVLEEIDHPLAVAVLKYRKVSKLASTYLRYYVNENLDGLIHCSINSVGARTSRMSVAQPNLQNLPRVSEGDRYASVVRNCIISRDGHTLMMCDFSQIETRLLAHLSQDPGLLAAFYSPDDFFVTLARTIFRDGTIGKKDPRRNIIKTLVYAKIYGAGVEKMAKTLGLSVQRMYEIDNALAEAYPGIRSFQEKIYAEAYKNKRETGTAFVICPLSGRKHIADPGMEYALVNYMIQGMAAFYFKKKLLELSNTEANDWMILPVHDEIILDVPDDRLEDCARILHGIMNDTTSLLVPVAAEISYGKRWAEKKDWVMAA